jgi:hypothetical protein
MGISTRKIFIDVKDFSSENQCLVINYEEIIDGFCKKIVFEEHKFPACTLNQILINSKLSISFNYCKNNLMVFCRC